MMISQMVQELSLDKQTNKQTQTDISEKPTSLSYRCAGGLHKRNNTPSTVHCVQKTATFVFLHNSY